MADHPLRQIQEISVLLNSSLDHTTIRKRAIEAATIFMNAEAGSLLLMDEASGELYFDVAHGEKGEVVRQARLRHFRQCMRRGNNLGSRCPEWNAGGAPYGYF